MLDRVISQNTRLPFFAFEPYRKTERRVFESTVRTRDTLFSRGKGPARVTFETGRKTRFDRTLFHDLVAAGQFTPGERPSSSGMVLDEVRKRAAAGERNLLVDVVYVFNEC